MFHLLIYWYKNLGKQLLIGSFMFQMSFIVCETNPFIIKIHGSPYIVDCEALDLKKNLKLYFNLNIHRCILNMLLTLKNT
jgi:hypothetical protein